MDSTLRVRSPRARGLRLAGLGAAAVTASGIATLGYASVIERYRYRLRRLQVPVLPPGSTPLRVLHLSDFHLAPWQRSAQDFIRSLADLDPDLIVDTGDNTGHADAIPGLRRMLEPFRGKPGLFVYGSNDYFGPQLKNPFRYFGPRSRPLRHPPRLDLAALEALLVDELGWQSLQNTATQLEVGGARLRVLGVDDPHVHYERLDAARAAAAALDPGAITIALTHAPYRHVLDDFTEFGAGLILAGHTHGGQVRVPGVGALVTNCDLPRRQARGLSLWSAGGRTAALHVSAGLGTSIFAPVRFACLPEASLLTLVAQDAER